MSYCGLSGLKMKKVLGGLFLDFFSDVGISDLGVGREKMRCSMSVAILFVGVSQRSSTKMIGRIVYYAERQKTRDCIDPECPLSSE